jgi:hypothetical protein
MNEAEARQASKTLADLRYHWDEAYEITHHPGTAEPYRAQRLDDGQIISATTLLKLRDAIIDDYSVRPVPRQITEPAPVDTDEGIQQ